jgi:hypothetical protein
MERIARAECPITGESCRRSDCKQTYCAEEKPANDRADNEHLRRLLKQENDNPETARQVFALLRL